jgi:hypothetical protein
MIFLLNSLFLQKICIKGTSPGMHVYAELLIFLTLIKSFCTVSWDYIKHDLLRALIACAQS